MNISNEYADLPMRYCAGWSTIYRAVNFESKGRGIQKTIYGKQRVSG